MAPFWMRCLMVGMAARILVSSVMFWLSSSGTLRSALTKTFFPFRSAALSSPTLFFAIDTTPLAPFPPLTAATRAATFAASSGSAAAKPRRRASGRERREEESCTREGEAEVAEEEAGVVVKKKKEREGEEAHVTTHVSYVRVGVYVERMYMVYTVWWWLRWRFVYSNVSRGVHVLVRESIYASCVRGPA